MIAIWGWFYLGKDLSRFGSVLSFEENSEMTSMLLKG
jgi:hypothetical protein